MMKSTIFFSLLTAVMLTACSGNQSNNQANATEAEANVQTISVDSLLNNAESLIDQQVTIEGVCSHTCRHGATKIFVMGSNSDNLIRCEAALLKHFSKECVHSVVRVTGYVRETRLDEDYLQRWKQNYEQAMMEQQAEQAAESQYGDSGVQEQKEEVSSSAGCETESRARGEKGNSIDEKIAAYREQIAARKEAEGKEYLSFYHIETTSYEIVPTEE